jgi:hypothetical protein
MSHIQDRLKSLSKAFRTFDTKEASFNGAGRRESSIPSSVSVESAESAGSHETGGSGGSAESAGSQASEASERSVSELSERSAHYKRNGLHQGVSLRTRTHNDPSVVGPDQVASLPTNTPKKTKSKSKMFLIVLIVLGLLILFGVVLYLLYKKRKRAQEDGTEKSKKSKKPNAKKPATRRQVRFGPSSVIEADTEVSDVPDPFQQIDAIGAKVNRPTPVILPPEEEKDQRDQRGDGGDGGDQDIVPF